AGPADVAADGTTTTTMEIPASAEAADDGSSADTVTVTVTAVPTSDPQVVLLDFNGATGIDYEGPVTITGIALPAFVAPDRHRGAEASIAALVLQDLQQVYSGANVTFTLDQPAAGTQYSVIYIGGDDSAFSDFGPLLGVSEKIDLGNSDRTDIGF